MAKISNTPVNASPDPALQCPSGGGSHWELHAAALQAAAPESELSWLDIGCGKGELLRAIRARYRPTQLVGVDVLDWLVDDLRRDVDLKVGPAELMLEGLKPVDRVLLVETLEHLEAPWTVLRTAARLVKPGGRMVITTPNIANLRHRLELLVRGQLTSFRPNNLPHLTPVLPHVIKQILEKYGFAVDLAYAGIDIMPLTGGHPWPQALHYRAPMLTSMSIVVSAEAPS